MRADPDTDQPTRECDCPIGRDVAKVGMMRVRSTIRLLLLGAVTAGAGCLEAHPDWLGEAGATGSEGISTTTTGIATSTGTSGDSSGATSGGTSGGGGSTTDTDGSSGTTSGGASEDTGTTTDTGTTSGSSGTTSGDGGTTTDTSTTDGACLLDVDPPGGACPAACTECDDVAGICNIDCAGCEGQTVDCPPGWACNVACVGVTACLGAIINCPEDHPCRVTCTGLSACADATVACCTGTCRVDCVSSNQSCRSTQLQCGIKDSYMVCDFKEPQPPVAVPHPASTCGCEVDPVCLS